MMRSLYDCIHPPKIDTNPLKTAYVVGYENWSHCNPLTLWNAFVLVSVQLHILGDCWSVQLGNAATRTAHHAYTLLLHMAMSTYCICVYILH